MPPPDPGLRSLIGAGSPVFAAIAATCLLVGGIAGVAADDSSPTGAEPAEVAAHTAADEDHGHGADPGTGGGHSHDDGAAGDAELASADHGGGHAHGAPGGATTDGDVTGPEHGHAGAHAPADDAPHRGAEHGAGGAHHGGAHDDGAAAGDHHAHAAGCADDHPVTVALVRDVQSNLVSTYKDMAALIALGYHPYFDSLVPGGYPPGGEGISHWINPSYIDDGVILDPQRPETILLDNWNWPIGMMFINDPGVAPVPVYTNADGSACSPWHPHTDAPARFGWYYYRAMYDRELEGSVPAQTPEMMHVWAIHNPAGVYAAHDYPPSEERQGAPGPIPSYFSEAEIPGR